MRYHCQEAGGPAAKYHFRRPVRFGGSMQRSRLVVLGLVAALTVAACGSRTTHAANISILPGPVPGLFKGAVNGTDAFFQYQNSLGGVYGRALKLAPYDDQFDCGQNRAITESNIGKVFAFVGSFSLFDNCGAQIL